MGTSLSNNEWKKITQKAHEETEKLAQQIYETYKTRKNKKGIQCQEDSVEQIDFESKFIYELTSDQKKAIQDIKQDLECPYPMDRLLCGDVGFGKTEVILQACFKMIDNNYQVILLAPTTLLVEQHI